MNNRIHSLTVPQQMIVCLRLLEKVKANNKETFSELIYSCIIESEPVFRERLKLSQLILRKLKRLFS